MIVKQKKFGQLNFNSMEPRQVSNYGFNHLRKSGVHGLINRLRTEEAIMMLLTTKLTHIVTRVLGELFPIKLYLVNNKHLPTCVHSRNATLHAAVRQIFNRA